MSVQVERRSRKRFRLPMAMKFSAWGPGNIRLMGTGTVIDISSKGLAFRTSDIPQRGMTISAALNWPAILNGECLLQLRIDGEVVRTGPETAVIGIRRYEFRTSGRVTTGTRDEVQIAKQEFGEMIATAALPADATR